MFGQSLDDAQGPLAEIAAHPRIRRRHRDRPVRRDAPMGVVDDMRRSHDGLVQTGPGIALVDLGGDADPLVERAVQARTLAGMESLYFELLGRTPAAEGSR